jgi:hypothetical protein
VKFARLFLPLLLAAPLALGASDLDLEFHGCAFAKGPGDGECQHFLRNPIGPTDDPCWCDKCRNGITGERHDGRTVPAGWDKTLFEGKDVEAYLKRHAVAWGITCSECLASDKPWPDGGAAPQTDYGGQPARKTIDARLAAERKLFKKPDEVVLAYDRHFYIATDVEPLKVRSQQGGERIASRHEWAHLMIERAEFARREWVRCFGEPMSRKPIALYFPQRERDLERIGAAYFRVPGVKGLRGGGADLCDGMCLTAIAFSREREVDDLGLQVCLRHMLSRNLLSIYAAMPTRPKSLPVWLDEGLAHWLVKTRFPNEAHYDVSEGQGAQQGGATAKGGAPSWPGKDWEKDIARWATQPGRFGVIEELLAKLDTAQMTEEDHKRAWSVCGLCLSEWREPFVKLVRALRQEKDVREAFTKSFGLTPEEFDERWKERVLGRRKSMAPQPGDDEPAAETPGERDRKSLRAETSAPTLAAKLRGLGEIKDVKTVPVVLDLLAQTSDLVRETAFVVLLKTKDKACLETLWTCGLAHPDAMVRTYAAKVCGRLKLVAALPKLRDQLDDKNWYARAEAAVACGLLKDVGAMAGMRRMVASDPAEKAQVGAIDSLAMFGEDAEAAVPLLAKGLEHAQWQIRVAAAQGLGRIGSMSAVDPLIARMEKETGRVQDEIYEALKRISRDDLGRRPAGWRKWWEKEKAGLPPGAFPLRPPETPKEKKPRDAQRDTSDEAPPKSFGVELYGSRVAFVLDTTETMLTLFTPDPSAMKLLSREYVGRSKLEICKEEIVQALERLDPRAHFNIVTFGMQIRSFEENPVPATSGNIEAAKSFLKPLTGSGRTNYYGALKAALEVGDEPDVNPDFKATPDTITFLTDGIPNEGDLIDADTLVEWYAGLNRYARVKTHTIAFGVVGIDPPLLKGLAERNGGRFTLVPERK